MKKHKLPFMKKHKLPFIKKHKLPNGEWTDDIVVCATEWNKLAEPIAEALNCDIIGFNPDIHLIEKGSSIGFKLSVTIANRILKLINK